MNTFPCAHAEDIGKPFYVLCRHPARPKRDKPSRACFINCPHYSGPPIDDKMRASARNYMVTLTIGADGTITGTAFGSALQPRRRSRDGRRALINRLTRLTIIPRLVRTGRCTCQPGDADEYTPIYRWLLIDHYGWPFLLRLRPATVGAHAGFVVTRMPGCGCVKPLKDLARLTLIMMETLYYGQAMQRSELPGSE